MEAGRERESGRGALDPGPSPADITFGRAILAFRLATKEQVEACVQDLRRLQAQGRPMTLAQVMVGRKIISIEQYQRLAQEIQVRLQAQAQQRAAARVAASSPAASSPSASSPQYLPPGLTGSGRYRNLRELLGAGPDAAAAAAAPAAEAPIEVPPSDEEIERAARAWEQASAEVHAEKARGGPVPYEVPSTEADPAPPDTVREPAHANPNASGKLTTPQAARERRDAGIRKILGVAEDAAEFDFGPYRILGEVASGGMGIIYRACETATGSVYALKALLNVENANEKQLKRFIQEAQSAMRLDHPGIVKIYDLGVFENIPYFTMDFIQGKDLHRLLRDKQLTTEEALRALVKVCDAVGYAHTQGVIHRDLKPANIILRPDGVPILTDFGLAKNLDSQFKLTAEGAMVGTPLYLSPEQVSGKGSVVDGRCDVYGLGVMLYQILTDRLPFFGRNPYEVYRKITEEDPPPPREINPKLAPEIERVCLMALAKDREERYRTATDMGADIARFLRGEPVLAKLPTPAAKPRESAPKPGATPAPADGLEDRASRIVLAAIAFLVIVVLAGLAYLVYALVTP